MIGGVFSRDGAFRGRWKRWERGTVGAGGGHEAVSRSRPLTEAIGFARVGGHYWSMLVCFALVYYFESYSLLCRV